MTKKDFELIADTLACCGRVTDLDKRTLLEVARTFAYDLARTNPNFNRARFLRACGVEG